MTNNNNSGTHPRAIAQSVFFRNALNNRPLTGIFIPETSNIQGEPA
jgi:hypothetical protein